jgi:hypothetical protein
MMVPALRQADIMTYRFLGPLGLEGFTNVHDKFKRSHLAHRDKILCSARWSLHFTFRLRQVSHA